MFYVLSDLFYEVMFGRYIRFYLRFVQGSSLGSFSEELARLLRPDEEDDATSPLKDLLPAKPESDLQNLDLANLVQFTEVNILPECQF